GESGVNASSEGDSTTMHCHCAFPALLPAQVTIAHRHRERDMAEDLLEAQEAMIRLRRSQARERWTGAVGPAPRAPGAAPIAYSVGAEPANRARCSAM